MKKMLESLDVVHTHTHGILLEKKTSNLILKFKHIAIMAILLLLCIFSNNAEARGEVPEDLIQAKENTINEIALGANNGITLTRTYSYNNGNQYIKLNWNAVNGSGKYKIYQTKEGQNESNIATIYGTEVTLNKANAGIRDDAAPTMPIINATQNADGTGNSITITPSTDNGTTYRHRIEGQPDIAYTEKSYITPGTYKWTCPEGITRVRVAVCGGGGGGSASSDCSLGEYYSHINGKANYSASAGGASSFGTLITASGGTGSVSLSAIQYGDNGDTHFFICEYGVGGIPNGRNGNKNDDAHNTVIYGGKGFDINFNMTAGNYGTGGNGIVANIKYPGNDSSGAGGGSGGYNTGYVTVTPNTTYTITVGAGGAKSTQTEYSSSQGTDGIGGFVLIAYGGEIQNETGITSNTVSTTVTSGIKGYQYAITTSRDHTFTNEEVVPLDKVPTFVSGEKQMVQYLHIRAVDNAGNTSTSQDILLQVPAKITLKSDYQYGMNYVPLSWINNDTRSGYVYRLYQKAEGENNFKQIASSNSKEQRIYKDEWSSPTTYATPGTFTYTVPEGITRIKVAVVGGGGRRSYVI